jgi:uncharacterized phage protein gp47/JayE
MTTPTTRGGGVGTPDQLANAIMQKLSITDPALSLEIGTPERKIVDAVAECISESTIDNYLLGTALDINTKSGTDLENFVQLFGFSRQSGRYAVGNVEFTLSFPATSPVTIPIASQVYVPASVSGGVTNLLFNTTSVATIATGTQTITVPVQSTLMGAIGNVASTSITGFIGSAGVASVINSAPTTGGVDMESDDQLRQRFKRTFLRNIAGTEDFYTALMLQSLYISQVLVLGPYSYFKEEIQFNGTAKMRSTNNQIKYLWPQGWFLYQNQGLPNENFYVDGLDFTVDSVLNPPGITPAHPALKVPGAVADFEYQYTTLSSRNDPYNQITNKVDIFINGTQATDVSEQIVGGSAAFTTATNSIYYTGNFKRIDDRNVVVSGHRFQPLGSVPIVTIPGVIYSPTTTYVSGTDYVGVASTTLSAGSIRELSGIEWLIAAPPSGGTLLTLNYTYNRLPEVMQALITAQKQITTDVLVHQANYAYCTVVIVVVYNFNVDISAVNTAITQVLTAFFTKSGFGAWIQMSDIEQAVHNISGVDNVRMAKSTDVAAGQPWAVLVDYTTPILTQYTNDFRLPDSTLGVLSGVTVVRRSSNTFT